MGVGGKGSSALQGLSNTGTYIHTGRGIRNDGSQNISFDFSTDCHYFCQTRCMQTATRKGVGKYDKSKSRET